MRIQLLHTQTFRTHYTANFKYHSEQHFDIKLLKSAALNLSRFRQHPVSSPFEHTVGHGKKCRYRFFIFNRPPKNLRLKCRLYLICICYEIKRINCESGLCVFFGVLIILRFEMKFDVGMSAIEFWICHSQLKARSVYLLRFRIRHVLLICFGNLNLKV